MPASMRQSMINYLGIHFKIWGHQLTRLETAYVIFGMIVLLIVIVVGLSYLADRKRKI